MYVYILELSIVSELLWFERERERKRKQREQERRTHDCDRPLRSGHLWQAMMYRMSYKEVRISGY